MGTIVKRSRANGSTAYMGKILLKKDGKVIHRETRTFDRKAAAAAWIAKRETEVRDGTIRPAQAVTLADAIHRYMIDTGKAKRRTPGRTKAQVLAAIGRHEIASMRCADIRSHHVVSFAQDISDGRSPATVANYLSHLAAIFAIAKPAWDYDLDAKEMDSARIVAKKMGIIGKSRHRDRRPTIEEMDRLMEFFSRRAAQSAPMPEIIAFALFSTRRQDEIMRIQWSHLEQGRILVEDMKHPGQKVGNNVRVDLPPEAEAILRAMPVRDARIFPYTAEAISAAFTRACATLGIDDLHFHDLRHEGITRLFEMGMSIPHVAAVSGHRSWQSLQRYTHVRQTGDRWAGWHWLDRLAGRKPRLRAV
jgi:integrase